MVCLLPLADATCLGAAVNGSTMLVERRLCSFGGRHTALHQHHCVGAHGDDAGPVAHLPLFASHLPPVQGLLAWFLCAVP